MNRKGFTLIEASVVIAISTFASIGAIKYTADKMEESKINSLSSKMVKLIGAIDQRIYIDKYNASLWPSTTDYITNLQVQEFMQKELIAATASCGDSANGWNPTIDAEDTADDISYKEKLRLVPCEPWGQDGMLEFGLNASLYVVADSISFKGVNVYLSFESQEDFEENFQSVKRVIRKSNELDTSNVTGSHNYRLVDMSTSDPSQNVLSSKECIDKASDCGFMAQFVADGDGMEYLDVTGGNSMIASKVSFKEGVNDLSPISDCKTFYQDVNGVWQLESNIVCGVGIDSFRGTSFVDADVHSTSSKKVYLDKLCKMSLGASNPTIDVPCGISTSYNDPASPLAIAVLDRVEVQNAYIELLEVKNVYTNDLSVKNRLEVLGSTELQDLEVSGNSIFKKDVELEGANNTITLDLTVEGITEVDSLTVKSLTNFEDSVNVKGYLNVEGYIEADHLRLGSITTNEINQDCSVEGALKVYKTSTHSETVICSEFEDIDGQVKVAWKLSNARIGQVLPFDGSCPAGFQYFEKAAGRFLIGANEDYVDGLTGQDLIDAINDGTVILDENGNPLKYKLGDIGGEAFHTLTEEEMPRHHHEVPDIKASCSGSDCAGAASALVGNKGDTVWSSESKIATGHAGGDQSHENRPPYYTVNYCIYTGK